VPKVLLVEDDATQLKIRSAVVRGAGFEVLTAADAESALQILSSSGSSEGDSVGIIITDHYLPGTTGAEFLRKVRETNPVLPVIVLSGLPGAEADYEGFDVIFRSKPCPADDIISLLRQSLDHAA
jgi:CheY-like chemotaxis protein